MNRRQFLATLGIGLGGVSGCLSGAPTGSTATPAATDGPATTPTEPPAETDEDTVTVSDIAVRKAVTYESLLGSGGVLAADGRQYVVAAVERDPSRETEFVFETGTDSWAAGLPTTAGGSTRSVAGLERPVVGFELPSPLSVSEARVRERRSGTGRALTADERAVLAAPAPRYELDGLSAPDRVSQGETMTVELGATNLSETDGRFLAALYWPTERLADDDESHVVDRTVPAGDTVTATVEIDTAYTATESGPVTLAVEGHVTASRTVRVEDVDPTE